MATTPLAARALRAPLAGLVAALLPAEHGGPDPAELGALLAGHLRTLPPPARAGVVAAALVPQGAALLRFGRTLGSLDPERRAAALGVFGRLGPSGEQALDGLKALVLLAHGAESHREEIRARGARFAPARPDAQLRITRGAAWPERSRCDVVVIGSGAGGAFAARALARAGRDVVIVEEGRRHGVEEFRTSHPLRRFGALYRDGGATVAAGVPPVLLPIGRAVGGTTVVNSGTCFRPPAKVAARWHGDDGLALAEPEAFDARLADAERTIRAAPAPLELIGRNGELLLEGAAALGWEAAPLVRNAPGCAASCQCAIGCPRNAKGGVHLNALPEACAAGAQIASELRVERVVVEGGRARGVEARRRDGRRVRIDADMVVVAAGATETPPLLRRSGLGRHPAVGRHLAIHPALGVGGWFEEEVVGWEGILQSAGCEQLHHDHGVLVEATSAPPGLGSMMLPGVGARLLAGLDTARHVATMGAMIADDGRGRVLGRRRATLAYSLSAGDRGRLFRAIEAMARILLAAGAYRVELGGGAPRISRVEELQDALGRVDVRRLHLAAFHPVGTARAGADAARCPVDPHGRLRGVDGVWVADGSILPSCPEVNPQVSIMALAAGVGEAAAAA